MIVTQLQASEAINIIHDLIVECFGEDMKYIPTEIRIHPKRVREMFDLVKEMRKK